MENYKIALFAVAAVLYCVCVKDAEAISCYSCVSNAIDGNGCGASPKNMITTMPNPSSGGPDLDCLSCWIQVTTTDTFSRGCSTTATSVGCVGQTCNCNTDNCNSKQLVYGRGTYQCYACSSVDYMDNGCGAVVDTSSIYVKVLSGCTACSKSVSALSGEGRYTRGCLFSTSSSNTCASSTSTCSFRCESNLCNTATTKTTTTTRYPIILALGFAIYGVSSL